MMAERIFCNRENKPFPATEFADGPDNVKIHATKGSPHTIDSWPVVCDSTGKWIIAESEITPLPADVDLDQL